MNYKWIISIILSVALTQTAIAQVFIKTEYIPPSSYRDENNNKVGGKGDFMSIQGSLQIPVSVKMNEFNQPTAWALALQGSYASMQNQDLSTDYCLNKLLNAQLVLMHTRPLSKRWSIIAMLGGGIYTDLSEFSGKCILGQGGVLFVRKMNPNLDLGGGVAINNVLGFPMAFFALYLDWHKNGKYEFNLSMASKFEISAGMKLNPKLKLRLVGEANGMSAVVEKDGESKIFVHNYSTIRLQPELKVGKLLTAQMSAGISLIRDVYFQDRTIKAFYADVEDYPHFGVAPYVSVGLKYGF